MSAGMDECRSYFERVVCLRSWWLCVSEDGKQLVVAGFSNKENQARRVFISAPILKRHDVFNLETVDGISVNLHGFMDKAQTEANGFSSEIFQHFLFGFPAWWEECAKKCLNKESTTELLSRNNTGMEASSSQGEHETADEAIVPGCLESLDSSNCDKEQYQSVETAWRNHSSVNNVEKQDAEQEKAIANPKNKKRVEKSPHASREECAKKCLNKESTIELFSRNNTGTDAASLREGEHETVDEDGVRGCLDSSNADKDQYQYQCGQTVWRNHSSVSNVEKQDAEQTTAKPKSTKRMKKSAQASRNLRSVKDDLTSAGKRKRTPLNMNMSRRAAEKKSDHVNESTPVHDTIPIASPEAASFRRSRSGRLLLPALNYWSNQRAVYDVDRKIIGVRGILDH